THVVCSGCFLPDLDSLNQLNKQIDEMNAALAKLERQRASQERNLAAQLDAAFRQGPHTGIQMVLSGEEGQRNQRPGRQSGRRRRRAV
ncbi:hypothetical protein FK514_27385, partial [Klebsiella pneumoniae]|nr:hypothetical protein [Klebsiella pneumoniae]